VIPYVDHNGNKLGSVDALFEDREGCLWTGTSAGLYRLTDRRGYTLPMKAGVVGGLALAVTQTRDGAVWISSWDDASIAFRTAPSRTTPQGRRFRKSPSP